MVQQTERTQEQRAERNRGLKTTRVYHIDEEYADPGKFREVALKGGVKPPVAYRTPGRGAIMGNTGATRLRYLSIEGPMPYGGAFDTTVVCEGD